MLWKCYIHFAKFQYIADNETEKSFCHSLTFDNLHVCTLVVLGLCLRQGHSFPLHITIRKWFHIKIDITARLFCSPSLLLFSNANFTCTDIIIDAMKHWFAIRMDPSAILHCLGVILYNYIIFNKFIYQSWRIRSTKTTSMMSSLEDAYCVSRYMLIQHRRCNTVCI